MCLEGWRGFEVRRPKDKNRIFQKTEQNVNLLLIDLFSFFTS
jgi:hypothetical protein